MDIAVFKERSAKCNGLDRRDTDVLIAEIERLTKTSADKCVDCVFADGAWSDRAIKAEAERDEYKTLLANLMEEIARQAGKS